MLVIGPWDQVIELSLKLNNSFHKFASQNSNITLSAGVLQVKPYFPIQRFTQSVDEWIEEAKEQGRNRVTAFSETVPWCEEGQNFQDLIEFGKNLSEKVDKKDIPRSFLHFLLRLKELYFNNGEQDCMWVPKFHYVLARRVSSEEREALQKEVPTKMEEIRIPVSYANLITRKE